MSRFSKKLPGVVQMVATLGVAGSLAYAAAGPAWHGAGFIAIDVPPVPQRAPAPATAAPLDLTPITALRPFGAVNQPEPEQQAPQLTDLNLVLQGVAVNPDPARSFALIADAGVTRSYRPDQPINDRATLTQVFATYVTLDVDGREEILSFPLTTIVQQPSEPTLADRLEGLLTTADPPIDIGETAKPETTEDYIELWRERIRRNPGEVLDAIGLIPSENGYIISENHDSGVALAGLKTGDVVTSVNGQAVGNVDKDSKYYDEVAASGQARIELLRNGKPIVMSFPLR